MRWVLNIASNYLRVIVAMVAEAVATLKDAGAQALITLMPEDELARFAAESLPDQCATQGLEWFHLPVEDDHAPDERFATAFATQKQTLLSLLEQQGTLAIHCRGGSGRTGFMAAILLLESGMDRDEVVRQVDSKGGQMTVHLLPEQRSSASQLWCQPAPSAFTGPPRTEKSALL